MSVAAPRGQQRRPISLVTDARDRDIRPQSRPQPQRSGTRVISVDSVLQYTSDIPSAQPRGARPAQHARTPSGRHPLDPKLSGRAMPVNVAHTPARTSKVSEKLVLLPETTEEHGEKDDFDDDDDDGAPPSNEELRQRRLRAGARSNAERLPKSQRQADEQIARVTAYCTAQSYKLRSTAEFVRDQHGAKTKLYDDCLYCVYQLPLLGGSDGFRVRSSPVVKNPGGRSVLDEQIEANERRQYREGWHEESDEYSVTGYEGQGGTPPQDRSQQLQEHMNQAQHGWQEEEYRRRNSDPPNDDYSNSQDDERRESVDSAGNVQFPSPSPGISPDASMVAELFVFSYGVAVLWNFTANQEKDLLADLTFSSTQSLANLNAKANSIVVSQKAAALVPPSSLPLMTRPLSEDDFETEDFHFQYDSSIDKPRIYNDMITLRTSDHMIKLAMSHAIAQSTKLSFFEESMQRTMAEAQYVPRKLALEGKLGMKRNEVVQLLGRLFEGRVQINLSSNMLDTPNFFWDSEPTLHPLYAGTREYLEIKPRVQVLNERCKVFLDLAEILSDSIADVKMTRITWIIIILIVISILVTCTEVFLRFAILAGVGQKDGQPSPDVGAMVNGMCVCSRAATQQRIPAYGLPRLAMRAFRAMTATSPTMSRLVAITELPWSSLLRIGRMQATPHAQATTQQPPRMDLLQSLILPTSSTILHVEHVLASEDAAVTNYATGLGLGSSSDANLRLQPQNNEHQKPQPSGNLNMAYPDAAMADYPYSDVGSVHAIPLEEFQAMNPPESQFTRIKPLETDKTTGQRAAEFNNLCQLHGIVKAYFTFQEIFKGLFSVHVQFGEHMLEDPGPFPNKKQAKEAICAQGIEVLKGICKPDKLKRKRSPLQEGDKAERKVSEVDDSEDWISILMWAVDKKTITRPKERYYEADSKHLQRQGFALSGRQYAVAMTIDGFLEVFGGEEMLFESKAMAKRNAAREAVFYLRKNHYLPAEQQDPRRRKTIQENIDSGETGHTGLTPGIAETKLNESVSAQVHDLALQLGFTGPTYKEKPATPPPGVNTATTGPFISMAAHFNTADAEREPRLAGPVGEVQHVFGKKMAKEQCARNVLEVLEMIKRDRVAQGERLL